MQVEKPRGVDGFKILSVDENGSAWQAGLRPGDVIAKNLVGPVGSDQFGDAQDAFIDFLCSLKTKTLAIFKVRSNAPASPLVAARRIHIQHGMVSVFVCSSSVVVFFVCV